MFRTGKGERSMSIPKSGQEFKEIVYNKMMPESLTKPCVVRCKVIWTQFKPKDFDRSKRFIVHSIIVAMLHL